MSNRRLQKRPPTGWLPSTGDDAARIGIAREAIAGDASLPVDAAAAGPRVRHFDYANIIAAPANGVQTDLIGGTAAEVASAVPRGYVGYVDAILPYLEGAAGPITQARIANATVTWKVLVDGRPAAPYGSITTILGAWGPIGDKPLLEIPARRTLSASVTLTDPNGLFLFVGLRVRGRLVRK